MKVQRDVAEYTGTAPDEWEFIDGPSTGVGVEHWLYNEMTDQTVYYVNDNGYITMSLVDDE